MQRAAAAARLTSRARLGLAALAALTCGSVLSWPAGIRRIEMVVSGQARTCSRDRTAHHSRVREPRGFGRSGREDRTGPGGAREGMEAEMSKLRTTRRADSESSVATGSPCVRRDRRTGTVASAAARRRSRDISSITVPSSSATMPNNSGISHDHCAVETPDKTTLIRKPPRGRDNPRSCGKSQSSGMLRRTGQQGGGDPHRPSARYRLPTPHHNLAWINRRYITPYPKHTMRRLQDGWRPVGAIGAAATGRTICTNPPKRTASQSFR